MATTHYSGAVDSVAGFSVNGTEVINSSAQLTGTQTAMTITTLTAPTVNATNVDAGASGTAGSVDVFPTTAANGKMILAAVDAGGAYNTTISNSAMGQSSVISIPDPGAATSKFVLQDGTNATATITTLTAPTVNATNVDAGASGTAGSVDVFPATAARGKIALVAANNAGDTTTTITNASQAGARTYTLGDVGGSAAFAMLAATPTATIGSTPAEIDLQCDVSLQTETIDVSTACSVTKRITKIASTGAGAVTLAAPDASMLGMVKIIEHISGAHDVTLSLANVQGGSAATTATFSDDNDALILVGGVNKWHVIGESGVVLS